MLRSLVGSEMCIRDSLSTEQIDKVHRGGLYRFARCLGDWPTRITNAFDDSTNAKRSRPRDFESAYDALQKKSQHLLVFDLLFVSWCLVQKSVDPAQINLNFSLHRKVEV